MRNHTMLSRDETDDYVRN